MVVVRHEQGPNAVGKHRFRALQPYRTTSPGGFMRESPGIKTVLIPGVGGPISEQRFIMTSQIFSVSKSLAFHFYAMNMIHANVFNDFLQKSS